MDDTQPPSAPNVLEIVRELRRDYEYAQTMEQGRDRFIASTIGANFPTLASLVEQLHRENERMKEQLECDAQRFSNNKAFGFEWLEAAEDINKVLSSLTIK